ncbi:MAG TPA: 50S ribosomal protein L29 [Anaerolineaceae bacterium]|uniref:Large ribosomal subunit protein uL29 n=1 Tax=Anaerolinea thermophila TaxID=167964 RepID=A0A117LH81_9CHLR|nr:MAG: 50S ribosomal protein L29 [Anaerolinea thermophila]HAF62923.1 50S ribosomal protein L29 [Anaerolineaceae bacterium]
MKIDEIRKFSDEELKTKIFDTKKEYMEMRFQLISGQLTDTSKVKKIRHDIARLETVIQERENKVNLEGEK